MTAQVILPQPPLEYDSSYERRRNARIESYLRERLPLEAAPVFGGIPLAILEGTNAALNILTATTTALPFNTTLVNDITLIDATGPSFVSPHAAVIAFGAQIYQTAALQTGNQVVTLGLYNTAGPTQLGYVNLERVYMNQNEAFSLTGFAIVDGVYDLDLRLTHNCAGQITVDMTQSKGWIANLSVNPKLAISERIA